MDLLHDLPVDPIAHAQQSIAVDAVNRGRQHGRDPPDQAPILAIEAVPGGDQRDRAPRAASPPDRSQQHVTLDRRVGVADVLGQDVQLPVAMLRQREEEVCLRPARPQRRDAPVRRPEEFAGVTERMPQRLVRLPHLFQVRGQAVDELQPGQLPLSRLHGASGWFPTGAAVRVRGKGPGNGLKTGAKRARKPRPFHNGSTVTLASVPAAACRPL